MQQFSLFLSLFPRLEREIKRERVKEERLEEEEERALSSLLISLSFISLLKRVVQPCFTLKF